MDNVLSGAVRGNAVQAGSIGTANFYGAQGPGRDAGPPHQLPPDVPTFINRDAEFAAAGTHLRTACGPGTTPVAVIRGGPGVGKTAFATRWAHSVSAHYEHGQLFLRFDADRRTPTDMVEGLLREALRALHATPELIPPKLADLVSLYRTVTAPLKLVIVIDDAHLDAEIKPLIPASPGSVVLVTSRHWMGELAADGAEVITLEPLGLAAAVELLGSIIGRERVAREPAEAARLAELCGRLPVAIRPVASRIAAKRDRPLSRFVAALEDPNTRLDRIDTGSAPYMTRAFNEAVQGFDGKVRRTYALLGDLGCPEDLGHWSSDRLMPRLRGSSGQGWSREGQRAPLVLAGVQGRGRARGARRAAAGLAGLGGDRGGRGYAAPLGAVGAAPQGG
jgi:hypothetical protein